MCDAYVYVISVHIVYPKKKKILCSYYEGDDVCSWKKK